MNTAPYLMTFAEYFETEKPNLPENGKYAESQSRERHKKIVLDAIEPRYIYGKKINHTIQDAISNGTITKERAIAIIQSAGIQIPNSLTV